MLFPPYVLVACLVGIVGFTLASHTVIAKQLDDWQLLPRPQRITELYFTDSKHLPTDMHLGKTQKLAFTIHNIEHQTTAYDYRIIAVTGDSNQDQLLGDGAVTLTNDQYQPISRMVQAPSIGSRAVIKVELKYDGIDPGSNTTSPQEQSIDYHVNVLGLR